MAEAERVSDHLTGRGVGGWGEPHLTFTPVLLNGMEKAPGGPFQKHILWQLKSSNAMPIRQVLIHPVRQAHLTRKCTSSVNAWEQQDCALRVRVPPCGRQWVDRGVLIRQDDRLYAHSSLGHFSQSEWYPLSSSASLPAVNHWNSIWVTAVLCLQGLSEECQYLFQPQLIVQRLIGISVLYPGYFIDQMIPNNNRSAIYK